MGQKFSLSQLNPVNYDCPVCQASNKIPNMAGRFAIINETKCQCNGCLTIFDKKQFYKNT
jgi:hypothetical protein